MTDAQRQSDAGQKLHEKLKRNANVLELDNGHIAAGLADKNHTAATEAERERLKAKLDAPPSVGRKVWDLASNTVTSGIKGATSDYGTWAKGTQKVYEKIAEGIKGDQEMEALRKGRRISSLLTAGSKLTGGEWREAAGIAPGMPGSFSTKIKSQVTDEVYKKIKTETEGFSTQELFNYYKKFPKETTDEYAQELKYQTLLKLVEKAKFMDKNQAQQIKDIFNGAKTKEEQITQWNKPVALQEYAGKMRGENHWFGDADITADDFYGFTGKYDNSKATLGSLMAAKGFLGELTIDNVKLKDGDPVKFSETLTRTLYDPDALSKTGKDVEDSFVNGFRTIPTNLKNMSGVRETEAKGKEKETKPTESAEEKRKAILDQIGEIKDLSMENPDLNQT